MALIKGFRIHKSSKLVHQLHSLSTLNINIFELTQCGLYLRYWGHTFCRQFTACTCKIIHKMIILYNLNMTIIKYIYYGNFSLISQRNPKHKLIFHHIFIINDPLTSMYEQYLHYWWFLREYLPHWYCKSSNFLLIFSKLTSIE